MSLQSLFHIAGSGMNAQNVRLNTIASNLSNAETISRDAASTYRARYPVFDAIVAKERLAFAGTESASRGVQVTNIVESQKPLRKEHRPGHPYADKEGYVYLPNVNVVEEMANMISASRSYQMNVEMLKTVKSLMHRTLQLGQ